MKLPKRKPNHVRVVFDIPTPSEDGKTVHFNCEAGEYNIKAVTNPIYDHGRTLAFIHHGYRVTAEFTKKVRVGR